MVAPAPAAAKSCCCQCRSEPTPRRDDKPRPCDRGKCGCADRNAVNLHDRHPDLPPPDPSPLAIVHDDSPAEHFAGSGRRPALSPAAATHVLDCVWLC